MSDSRPFFWECDGTSSVQSAQHVGFGSVLCSKISPRVCQHVGTPWGYYAKKIPQGVPTCWHTLGDLFEHNIRLKCLPRDTSQSLKIESRKRALVRQYVGSQMKRSPLVRQYVKSPKNRSHLRGYEGGYTPLHILPNDICFFLVPRYQGG